MPIIAANDAGTAQASVAKTLIVAAGVRVYEGLRPPDSVLPCAVLFVDNGVASRSRMVPVSDRVTTTVRVTSVGLTVESVRAVAQRVREALLDVAPSIPGRAAWPISQDDSSPLMVDRDVTPHVLYTADVYTLATIPAPS